MTSFICNLRYSYRTYYFVASLLVTSAGTGKRKRTTPAATAALKAKTAPATRRSTHVQRALEDTGLDSDEPADGVRTQLPPPQTVVPVADVVVEGGYTMAEDATPSMPSESQQNGNDRSIYLSECKLNKYTLPAGVYTIKSRKDCEGKLAFGTPHGYRVRKATYCFTTCRLADILCPTLFGS